MNNIENKELLSALSHDLTNIFCSIALAGDGCLERYKQLLQAYQEIVTSTHQVADPDIVEDAPLVMDNLGNITQSMQYGNLYIKSLNYNFSDFSSLTQKEFLLTEAIQVANQKYQTGFRDKASLMTPVENDFMIQANYDVVVNILMRFIVLAKYFGVLTWKISSIENQVDVIYEKGDVLKKYSNEFFSPTFNVSEMKIAFNLSLAYSYLRHLGGSFDVDYSQSQTCFKLRFPEVIKS